MRQIIIADSSALFSLFIDSDTNHKKAFEIKKEYLGVGGIVIIPSEVFSELINILGKKIQPYISS
jgi:predicted nucleic acid-binding protein